MVDMMAVVEVAVAQSPTVASALYSLAALASERPHLQQFQELQGQLLQVQVLRHLCRSSNQRQGMRQYETIERPARESCLEIFVASAYV